MSVSGIINIMKPAGITSHDVVDVVRRKFKLKKVGHTGTLDPAATGVLPICVGRATKIAQYITGADKAYRAEITLGISTDTLDAEGTVLKTIDAAAITEDLFKVALSSFKGDIEQIPPMASAIKIGGKKLYELQRQGQEIERPARSVTIYDLKLVKSTGWGTAHPRALLDIKCSKGTYIRTICQDIGNKLGVGAHMSSLVRTAVGNFKLAEAITLAGLEKLTVPTDVLISVDTALDQYAVVLMHHQAVKSVLSGAKLYPPGVLNMPDKLQAGQLVRLKDQQQLIALAEVQMEQQPELRVVFKPIRMIMS